MSLFTSLNLMAAIIIIIGFTSGAIWIIGPVLSAESVPPPKRGAAIEAYRTFSGLGSFIGPIIMAAVMTNYGIKFCFYIAGGLMFITLSLVLMIKETGKSEGELVAH